MSLLVVVLELFWTVVLRQTDPENHIQTTGGILAFYNAVCSQRQSVYWLKLRVLLRKVMSDYD